MKPDRVSYPSKYSAISIYIYVWSAPAGRDAMMTTMMLMMLLVIREGEPEKAAQGHAPLPCDGVVTCSLLYFTKLVAYLITCQNITKFGCGARGRRGVGRGGGLAPRAAAEFCKFLATNWVGN